MSTISQSWSFRVPQLQSQERQIQDASTAYSMIDGLLASKENFDEKEGEAQPCALANRETQQANVRKRAAAKTHVHVMPSRADRNRSHPQGILELL